MPIPRAPADEFVAYCCELLAGAGRPRSRRMFGGHGIYLDDLFVAIVAGGRLYLKADDRTRGRFEAEGCEPFRYEAQGHEMRLAYFTAPHEATESPALMTPWARLALEAALRASAAKAAPKKSAVASRSRRKA